MQKSTLLQKRKPYNGKVLCIGVSVYSDQFTYGKTYEFVNGRMTDDRGKKYPTFRRIKSFNEFQLRTSSLFIELKGSDVKCHV
jgi:hypothetical protein